MNALVRFFTRMDARAARAVYISLGLFALVAAIFVIGKFGLNLEPGQIGEWFESASDQWYALPVTILIFTVLAFVGAPQFALIGAAVFAFGPVQGFLYSWIATLCSATVTFYAGRLAGADAVRRYGGQTVNRISEFVGRNGFFASMIVRIVPSAPFIVVNMAAGVSHMSYFAFIAGLALGVIPKTALVAFAGGGLIALFAGGGVTAIVALVAVAAAWIGFMLVARRWLRGPADRLKAGEAQADSPDAASGDAASGGNRDSHGDLGEQPVEDSANAGVQRGDRLAIGDGPSHKES